MSNQKNKANASREFHHKLAIKITVQYLVTVLIFETAYILLNLLFLIIMGTTNLDRTVLFIGFKPFMIPIMIVVSLIGCGYITYRFMRRPLDYLDEVAEAAEKLAHPTDAPLYVSELWAD